MARWPKKNTLRKKLHQVLLHLGKNCRIWGREPKESSLTRFHTLLISTEQQKKPFYKN